MKNLFLLVCLFFIVSCGSDDSVETEQETEEVITPEEEVPDDEDPADFSIPDIVVVGESFDDNLGFFMIQWDQEYSNSTVTDLEAQINFPAANVLSSSRDSFFIKELGTNSPNVFKYDLNNTTPEVYSYDTYFADNSDDNFLSVRDARKTYLTGHFTDANIDNDGDFIYTYNIATGVSKTAFPEDIFFDFTKIFDSYVVSYGRVFLNSQETVLHIFSPETDQEVLLPFNEYSAVIFNNVTNKLFLFKGTGFISDYDIFDLNSFEITGSASLQSSIQLFGIFPDTYFYQDKMMYAGVEVSQAGGNQTPAIYDFSSGEKNVFDPSIMLFTIADSGVLISNLTAINLDLETETLVVGFEQNINSERKGAIAFFTYDYEIKRIIQTDNIKVENAILKD